MGAKAEGRDRTHFLRCAPISAIRVTTIGRLKSTHCGRSMLVGYQPVTTITSVTSQRRLSPLNSRCSAQRYFSAEAETAQAILLRNQTRDNDDGALPHR